MARILCNLALDCFDDRESFAAQGIELVTYGLPERGRIDGVDYPPDVVFDPTRGTIYELLAKLPAGFTPDLVLIYWPDQDPLPLEFQDCPVPTVGVMSDYNLTLHNITGLWPFFDLMLTDRAGQEVFRRLSFADVRYFCQYSFKRGHRRYPDERRTVDVGFAGNLNPVVQRERAPWLERLVRLTERGVRAEVRCGIFGEEYGRFLSRTRIGFNRSIRSEVNLRTFEVPACGALLFVEDTNSEIREYFTPGEEVVLYGDDDFEEQVLEHLGAEQRRARIAEAGWNRVQSYRMSRRLPDVARMVAAGVGQRPGSTEFDRALGRGTAMLSTWASGRPAATQLLRACQLRPEDPRAHNALALALLQAGVQEHGQRAVGLLQRALSLSPTYVPAATNLTRLMDSSARPDLAEPFRVDLERRLDLAATWADFDGPVIPLGFSTEGIDLASRLRDALISGEPRAIAPAFEARTPVPC